MPKSASAVSDGPAKQGAGEKQNALKLAINDDPEDDAPASEMSEEEEKEEQRQENVDQDEIAARQLEKLVNGEKDTPGNDSGADTREGTTLQVEKKEESRHDTNAEERHVPEEPSLAINNDDSVPSEEDDEEKEEK